MKPITIEGISKSDDHIITTQNIVKEADASLGATIFKCINIYKNNIAQIDGISGEKDTFGQLLQRCIRTALHLSAKNISRENIVALSTHNHLNSIVPFIAAQFIGAKVAYVDPFLLSSNEMNYLLKQIKPKILFTVPESVLKMEQIIKDISVSCEIVVFGQTSKYCEFSDFIKQHENEENFQPVHIENLNDTALITFSSGTTGLPKGICISHYSFLTQIYNSRYCDNLDTEYFSSLTSRVSPPLVTLSYASSYWISGVAILLINIIEGTCRLLCPYFEPKEAWSLIQKFRPMWIALMPFQVIDMIEAGYPENIDLKCVATIIILGSMISKDYFKKLCEIFPDTNILPSYGQTETCGIVASFNCLDKFHRLLLKVKPESAGIPIRGMSCKVVDLDTNKNLGPNEQGELRIKSKYIMNGYYNMDSLETFDEDGWLKTGDIVYYDEDYCFYIVDRIKESFRYKGWPVTPAIIENELLQHPAVKQGVVIGIPKGDDGYHPMGVVILKDDANATGEEIEKYIEGKVQEGQRLRAGVKIVKSLPMTVSGKPKRIEIRDMILNNQL